MRASVRRSRVQASGHDLEELVAEGLVILCDLARRFKPQLEGYAQEGRFSGYAARFLPVKLGEAWHRMHPHHVLRTQPDGSRRYEYMLPAQSLSGLISSTDSDFTSSHAARKGVTGNGGIDDGRRVRILGEFVPPPAAP